MSGPVVYDERLHRVAEILSLAIDARRKGCDRVALIALDEIIEMDDELAERFGGVAGFSPAGKEGE